MANDNVLEFTDDNWAKEVAESTVPVIVDFWAPWCGPCRALGPVIDKLATQFAGKVKIGKLNVDEAQETAAKYGVNSIPRILFFKGGERPVETVVGLRSEADLAKTINGLLQTQKA
jgi:thioredoxin 1